jgi:hypothetical protein
MSSRGSLALLPRTKRGMVLFWTALFMLSIGLQYAAAAVPKSALAGQECESYAIFTSDPTGEVNNQNIYDSKADVFLNGGPASAGGNLTAGTVFYYQVQEPNGTPLMEIRSVTVLDTGPHAGRFFVGLAPFDDTSNSGGEYKVVVSTDPELKPGGCTKSDNFKVVEQPGSLRITKDISGGPEGTSGSFDVTVDCGAAGTFERTITVPDPGEVTITGIAAGAVCTVDENIIQEDPPLGYHWTPPTIVGSPATIVSGQTVTIEITNNLELKPGTIKINKLVEGGPEGFTGSFDITVDCGDQQFSGTIQFPNPGFIEFAGVKVGAECTVTEESMSAAPDGFEWGPVTYSSNPTTIPGGKVTEVDVVNHLNEGLTPDLTIEKSNDAPGVGETPLESGDTVGFKLDYTLANGPVDDGIIEDVLPAGLTYVTGSATDSANGEFVFDGYDSATRTLTWLATEVTENGSVTYEATVDAGAAELVQPLTNTACIDSADTEEDCAESDVFVGEPPLAETAPPNTAPPTDIAGTNDSSAPGGSLLLVLLALAGIGLALVFVAPTPAAIRKRMR